MAIASTNGGAGASTPYNPLNSNMYVAASGSSTGTVVQGAPGYVAPQGPTGSSNTTSTTTGAATGAATGPTGPVVTGPTGSVVTAALPTIPAGNNAIQMLTALFTGYGLTGDIAAGLAGLKQGGLDDTTIQAIMASPDPTAALKGMNLTPAQQTAGQNLVNAWNTRFAGNTLREKAGLQPLSPSEYINTENSYKQVLASAGLPASTMDKAYLGQLIAADVSPAEVQMRVNAATDAVNNEDAFVIQQLQSQYGLTKGQIALHLLDPATAAPVIQQQVQAAKVGAEAARANANIDQQYAMQLAAQGVTQAQAAQGFGNIANQLPGTQALANRYQGYIQPEGVGNVLQSATFGTQGTMTQAQAEAELNRLKAQEVGAFSGSSGVGKGTLMGSEEGQQ